LGNIHNVRPLYGIPSVVCRRREHDESPKIRGMKFMVLPDD
jgi:hypothetical protein